MPCVGDHARTRHPAAFAHRIAVKNLLDDDGDRGGQQRHGAGTGQQPSVHNDADGTDAVHQNPRTYGSQRKADDDRGERLVFAVAVVVSLVLGFGRNLGKGDHHHVGRHVGERVYGVGDHGAASAQNTRREFDPGEQEIDRETDKGHAVYFLFADFSLTGHNVRFYDNEQK